MRTRWSGARLAVAGTLTVAVALPLAAGCADESTGGDSEAEGGTEEVMRHLEALDAAYAEGGSSEVQSHLRALDTAWEDAQSDVSDGAQVQEMIDSLQTEIDDQAPPEQVSATIQEIDQAIG